MFVECILEWRPQRAMYGAQTAKYSRVLFACRDKLKHQRKLSWIMYTIYITYMSVFQFVNPQCLVNVLLLIPSPYLLPFRTASPEQSANFSSLTGPSKECQKLEKASLTSLDKCTKPRNSLDRMDQSLYTAGKEEKWHGLIITLNKLNKGWLPHAVWIVAAVF